MPFADGKSKACGRDLTKLKRDIDNCQACPDAIIVAKNFPFKNTMRYVPTHTKLMFVAESPPISGKYLYDGTNERFAKGVLKLLKAAGFVQNLELDEFAKAGFYFTDVLKCPKGKVQNCKAFLMREIQLLNPEVICTFGKEALKAFLRSGQFKMEKYVGRFVPPPHLDQEITQGKPVFVCYFPMKYPVSNKVKVRHLRRLAIYLSKHSEVKRES